MITDFSIGYYESPIGILKIKANNTSIVSLYLDSEIREDKLNDVVIKCKEELDEYFEGKRTKFDIGVEFLEGTEFQQKVWNALNEIPYGETVTYKNIAEKIGNPKAVRAVGGANNKNPIFIIVPCHRVIGSNGKLVGYAAGVEKKSYLLELEREKI